MIFYKLIKEFHPQMSLQSIGDLLGKNHATILHALNEFPNVCKFDKRFYDDYMNILAELKKYRVDITEIPNFEIHPLIKYEIKSIRKVLVKRGQNAKRRHDLRQTAISKLFHSTYTQ